MARSNSFYSQDPPEFLSVYLNRTNSSEGPPDQIIYAFKGTIIAPLQEPPLERAVSNESIFFFTVFVVLSRGDHT